MPGADAAARLTPLQKRTQVSQERVTTSTEHRLDPDVFAAARKALDDDPRIPQDVRVQVDRGTVTLTGTVRWPHEKSEAEAVVRQIVGVMGVVNHITVAQVANPEAFEAPDPASNVTSRTLPVLTRVAS